MDNSKDVLCCFSRGKLKKNDGLVAGDIVEFEQVNDEYVITKLEKRKNFLVRPPVSNVDRVIIVLSSVPKPDFMLVDKILINCRLNDIDVYLCVNKTDISEKSFVDGVIEQYKDAVDGIIDTSALKETNICLLEDLLKSGFSVFAGQSAVGKSSLLNALLKENVKEIGGLSKKTERGKHTTRTTEIYRLSNGGYIADTPGFSFFDVFMDYRDLHVYYNDFMEYQSGCKFNYCTHTNEPFCKIKEMVDLKTVSKERYERYLKLYNELKEKWSRRYD